MAVNLDVQQGQNDEGQSVIEFVLMLPMLLGLVVTLIRINTAIQISIVNQQYARAQILYLTFNSPFYPQISYQEKQANEGSNQMVVGVSENTADAQTGDYTPEASIQMITRSKRVNAPDTPGEEPDTRAKVRIRDTVTLCTRDYSLGGNQPVPILPTQGGKAIGSSALGEQTRFTSYCGTKMGYEQ